MRAAIYSRYSSENQRPESIDDQVSSCKKLAALRGFSVDESLIFPDEATSGARSDRKGLASLLAASAAKKFDVVLVDDLSRLARDNYLMLSLMAELHFNGVRVVSVADGLDTGDEEAKLGIQIRGIFNELQLSDLKKKTLRGQMGQKQRGFIAGEATFGYRSTPVGTVRMDKKGRPRPDGYKMTIEPHESAVVLRIFQEFAEGKAESRRDGLRRLFRTQRCFFANARPDGDFRYLSNPNARASSSNRTATIIVHGRYFDVWGLIPELCATKRRSGSSVMPT